MNIILQKYEQSNNFDQSTRQWQKEATIIVREERKSLLLFEKRFEYKDEEKHPLRFHLLKVLFMEKFPKLNNSLGILSIRKLLEDITEEVKFYLKNLVIEILINENVISA